MIFDTDILSNIVKQEPSYVLVEKLTKVPRELQFTSAITIGEIYYGAHRSNRKKRIIEAFNNYVFHNVTVVPFDEESGKVFGEIKAILEKKRLSCSEPDIRIAAIAIHHNMILITGNTKHFSNIPNLEIENWIT
ncbi:MAG: hypothetical protein A2161_14195 [Candidatus Schekmanbacteria bacterium RBG_13_48_7]|uniref:PIN domain-containing protein n=1 Tax=Candidatus Schekmanbacteria bacterium RBG_13_48_7 TaxID=1817878 RepID=A0A1F7S0F2_9BACT|nr:MAG: hypothetical protein A2161_14195 [Candidatus Schekmanbacteria bacterium RBG_13_48_7]